MTKESACEISDLAVKYISCISDSYLYPWLSYDVINVVQIPRLRILFPNQEGAATQFFRATSPRYLAHTGQISRITFIMTGARIRDQRTITEVRYCQAHSDIQRRSSSWIPDVDPILTLEEQCIISRNSMQLYPDVCNYHHDAKPIKVQDSGKDYACQS